MDENRHPLRGPLILALVALLVGGAVVVVRAILSNKELLGFTLMLMPILAVACLPFVELFANRWGGTIARAVRQILRSWRPRFSLRTLFVCVTFVAIFSAYAGSYIDRSARGRYEPGGIGLNGVKFFIWIPEGFESDTELGEWMRRLFYPLFILDVRLWHTYDKAYDGDYPVNNPFEIK